MDSASNTSDSKSQETDIIAKTGLHQKLDRFMILRLKKIFQNQPGAMVDRNKFRKLLYTVCGLTFTDEEFKVLFLKIDSERTGDIVTWSEFLAHIILGFREEQEALKHTSVGARLEPPITGEPRIIRSYHRHPVIRITFFPEISHSRTINDLYGSYITCSKDGVINYWSVDMKLQKSVVSTCPELKVQPTWVTDLICMADVSVICTAGAERDLRFYDTTAQKFELRVSITSLPNAVCCLNYCFYEDYNKKCKLIIGDMSGCVKIIEFIPKDRGPFKSKPGIPMTTHRWEQFIRGAMPSMTVIEFPLRHIDWVRQVAFYEKIGFLISIAPCSKSSMILHNMSEKESSYIFKVQKGFWCMAHEEQGGHLIATGGPDGLVRVWNPFVTKRAVAVLRGHHAGIVSIVLQGDSNILCSISQDRCVKIWHILTQNCMQSYVNIPPTLGERIPFSTYYNPSSRQVFVAGLQIAVFQIYPLLNGDYTDGFTHSKDISIVLFNTLFKIIVTCGYDSFIIVWDPFTGRRMRIIREAHSVNMDGVLTPIEITAATFDPSNQLLITGAEDGSLKVWNFNTGTCIRNMSIGDMVVSAIVWLKLRILVMGENRCVTEFTDSNDVGASNFKSWVKRHSGDILCAATRPPQALVTGSYNGELIFWRLETGQAYGARTITPKARSKPKSKMTLDDACQLPTYSIQDVLFLSSRPMQANIATLVVAIATGFVQLWSHASGGGLIKTFNATHAKKDYVVSMATDNNNDYLITGHYAGYVKVWLMKNYGLPEGTEVDLCMPKLRLIFPFTWSDLIPGRAKKARRKESLPVLLSSIQAHYLPVTGLAYLNDSEIIVSCSADCTARMWTLGGRYLYTLGSFKPFEPLVPDMPADPDRTYHMPADIQRFCSHTTFRILSGGEPNRPMTKKQKARRAKQTPTVIKGVYGKRIDMQQILGVNFSIPMRSRQPIDIKLDTTLRQIPVYKEFLLPEAQVMTKNLTIDKIKEEAKYFKRRLTNP